jgi:Mrp family chromosome partitioning ATPase
MKRAGARHRSRRGLNASQATAAEYPDSGEPARTQEQNDVNPEENVFARDLSPVPEPEPMLSTRIRREIVGSCAMALRRIGPAATIGVTSSTRGEGRTTVACALALAASSGARAVLLELDVEHPRLAELADVRPGPGIVELVRGVAPIEECLQRGGEDLDVVVRGGHEHLESLIKGLPDAIARIRYRDERERAADEPPCIVIADLPPVDSGLAATLAADAFDTVVLVVRAGGVEKETIAQSAALLGRKPFVVLNGSESPASSKSRRTRSRRRK